MVRAARSPDSGEVEGGPFSATFSQEHRYKMFAFQYQLLHPFVLEPCHDDG